MRTSGAIPVTAKGLSVLQESNTAPGPNQLPTQMIPSNFSPGVKRPGGEADHLQRSGVEVKSLLPHTLTYTVERKFCHGIHTRPEANPFSNTADYDHSFSKGKGAES